MIHWRTVRALSIVSAVVNVLDTTTTSVVSGSRPLSDRATSTGSTLARKRSCLPLAPSAASPQVRSAVCTKRGPRKEPPMPMATTEVSGLPVCPSHSPLRTFSVKSLILSRTSQTSGTTFLPSTLITLLRARARGDVEHGAVLRGVDVLAREHGVDLALEVRLVGQFVELRHRLLGDALPGVVAVHAVVLDGEGLASLLVLDEVP